MHKLTILHREKSRRLCFFTTASDTIRSGIFTPVPMSDTVLDNSQQRHKPLEFLSDLFNASQHNWDVIEKDALEVMETLDPMNWKKGTPEGFDLFTDQKKSFIFLLDPLVVVCDLSKTTFRMVLCREVLLTAYNYTCRHIKEDENVLADLLWHWYGPAIIKHLIHIPELPSSSAEDFSWPTIA